MPKISSTKTFSHSQECENVLVRHDFAFLHPDFFRFRCRDFGAAGFEAFHPAGYVNQLLLAGIEGMAVRADFHPDFFLGGAGSKTIAAGAGHFGLTEINGVNVLFHS